VIYSLAMDVEVVEKTETAPERWLVVVPWLNEPVEAGSFEAAYWKAMRMRTGGATDE
jgi:hypothetical protein